ncbi:MAG: DNA polymerase III subunit gamma/tau [Candidatus Riflebacteria bacterium]|nr:DNA polymerase III subunit gamma/tau [Candidatus Riflebacteria bacterium]MBR4570389.1 DNA polymerase III subunit gamma/tau [Candidatus Riflebacteria bacterium]
MTVPARQNLYRKYRPRKFSELAGQEHISKTIQSAIATGRVSHAYMFSGPRGTGKTSSARLLAKILNCQNLQKDKNGLPDCCGVCDNCKRIEEMNFMDIVEIDAASNNGVEDIRQMREKVKYKPAEGKYKIYIIDEVHMLSGSAFNAFLKTLEEPPESVIFVLATTDPQKVPATIISRCQCFDFHSVSRKTIQTRLEEIVALEHESGQFPDFEPEALSMIAECAEGGFRDALSILDQISSSSISEKITLEQVLEMTRRLSYSTLRSIAEAVFKHDLATLVKVLNELYVKGYEPLTIARDLLEYLRRCMLLKIDSNANQILDLPAEQINEILSQIKEINVRYLIGSVSRVERILMTLRNSLQARILFESELIKLGLGDEIFASEALEKRIEVLEQKLAGLKRIATGNQVSGRSISPKTIEPVATVSTPIRRPVPVAAKPPVYSNTPAASSTTRSLNDDLSKLRAVVEKSSKIVSSCMESAVLKRTSEGVVSLTLAANFAYEKLKEDKSVDIILNAAKEIWPNTEKIVVSRKIINTSAADLDKNPTVQAPVQRVNMREEIAKIDEKSKQKVKEKQEVSDALEVFGGDIISIE